MLEIYICKIMLSSYVLFCNVYASVNNEPTELSRWDKRKYINKPFSRYKIGHHTKYIYFCLTNSDLFENLIHIKIIVYRDKIF